MQKGHEGSLQRKRLRQTSLDSFASDSNKRRKSDLDREAEDEVLLLEGIDEMSSSGGGALDDKRNTLADAAEQRRNATLHHDKPQSKPKPTSENAGNRKIATNTSTPNKPGTSAVTNNEGTKPKSVFAYLEDIDSIPCNVGASPTTKHSPKRTLNDDVDRPSTSSGRGAYRTEGRRREEEVEVLDSSQGECSETLEYDGSQPLFSDSDIDNSQECPADAPRSLEGQQQYGKGASIKQLNQAPACREKLPELKPDQNHTILFRPHFKAGVPPRPFPDQYQDRWDATHVRMPCSPENLYPAEDKEGHKKVQSRWEIIETTLLNNISNSYDLEDAILTYNARYNKKWDFRALHHFFTEVLDQTECEYFFDSILPGMVRLALQLPKLCTKPIPLLRRQNNHSVTLTQQQVASLLANAFFCTFPRRNAQQKKSEYSTFPDINFNRLFEGTSPRKTAKIQCIVNYFRRVIEDTPTGTVTYTRCALKTPPRWDKSTATLTKCHITASGMIEDEGAGMLQMDFANKFLGGGVLGHGCVQEEIRFLICPELILSRLIAEFLDDNECVVIKGVERFSYYSGYSNSFKWTGNFIDKIPRDAWGRKETEIVAIDALRFRNYESQLKPEQIKRELNKAYCGFHGRGSLPRNLPAIATGNWGCGAFGGDTRIKGILQMMAAAECQRQLCYFTFGDKVLCDDLSRMHQFITSSSITVGDLWNTLQKYRMDAKKNPKAVLKLFPYIYSLYSDYESSTEDEREDASTGSKSPTYKAETP